MTLLEAEHTRDPLEPLCAFLLAQARSDAEATLADADAVSAGVLEDAQEQAERLLSQAEAQGAAEAAAVIAGERARAGRTAHAVVLAARRASYDAWRQQARDAVSELRSDPCYPALLEALRDRVRRELGPDATVWEHERGGIVGEAGGRRMDFSLDELADGIVGELGLDLDRSGSS